MGFEIRDQIVWIQFQGFPKSLDVSKAIDDQLDGVRTVEVGRRVVADLLSDVEHHGTALVKALDEAIDPPSLPGTPRFVLADGSVRVLQTVRAEVEAVLAQLPNWGADPS